MDRTFVSRIASRPGVLVAAFALCALAASPARALNVGYYEMCNGTGSPLQAPPITNAGHTAISLSTLSPAELAGVDVIMVNNCDNFGYAQAYLDALVNVDAAVAAGKILVLHDRFVDLGETILPGGSTFDVQRHLEFPDPLNEAKDINVLDGSTLITNGPAGVITDTSLDGGTYSNHGFTVAGSLPETAKLVLSTNVPDHIVTFVYTYGSGAVMYSSIPLDHYLGGSTPFTTIYAVNLAHYAAYLTTSCGNGLADPGEDCDIAADNGVAGNCCTSDCRLESPSLVCRTGTGVCDAAEICADSTDGFCPADALEPSGTICRAVAGVCDVPETCDGVTDACPVQDFFQPVGYPCTPDSDLCTDDVCGGGAACTHPAKPDTDLDGTCNEQDICTNPGGFQNFASKPRSNVKFTRINTDTLITNDGFKVSASFTLGGGKTFASLDPIVTGARIVVQNEADVARLDRALPGGFYGGRGTRGWKLNRSGTTWSYIDTTSAPLSGIKRAKLSHKPSAAPGQVQVSFSGGKSHYPVVGSDVPLHAFVVFGDHTAAEDGYCGESDYGPGSCSLNASGNSVVCK